MGHSFSVVLPYYNEANYLPRTLRSWLSQTRRPDQLVLVDNGSTDGSADICRAILDGVDDIEVIHLHEPRPGKIYALETGCARVTGSFTVLADADTYYPPHYLDTGARMATEADDSVVAIMALPAVGEPSSVYSRLHRRARLLLAHVATGRKALVGGHGQILRTSALFEVGGFSIRHWRYVLLDHEILNRLFRLGRPVYRADLWCAPSSRRGNRRSVRWTFPERVLYLFSPQRVQDWFFYGFLAPRLARRQMSQLSLREQPWLHAPAREQRRPELRPNPTVSVGVDSG